MDQPRTTQPKRRPVERRTNLSIRLHPCVYCGMHTDMESKIGGKWVRVCGYYKRHPPEAMWEKEPATPSS